MTGLAGSLRRNRRAARAGSCTYRTVVLCLLSILFGTVVGCGGGLAPVRSPAEPPIPGRDREYVVGKGDTVYAIAWRHRVDYRALARFNSIRDPYTIYPGQRLLIPGPDDIVPPESEPDTETQKSPAPAPEAAAQKSPAPGADAVTHAADTETAPVVEPLPAAATTPIAAAAVQSLSKGAELPPSTAPKESSIPPAKPPSATRVAAGLRWSRPTNGEAIGKFGRSGNKGLDIAGTFEQPIRAASNGMVVYAGSGLVGYGKLVIVKHNSHILSAYAHNERLLVKEGDQVRGGQHIADMGRSGKGRPMLHFEIRRDGKPVDPRRYLP